MKNHRIKAEEITVVLQGSTLGEYKYNKSAELAICSIRKVMPKCKIILSTWESEKENIPKNLKVDKIILNKDPGYQTRDCTPDGKPNNVNRQIVSTINGLKKVETKYALKMRTDFMMKNCNFLKYFDKYQKFDKKYQIFEKKILCIMPGTRKPKAKHFNLPFHISDQVTFGQTKDMIKLFDIPLVTDEEFKWFIIHSEFMPDTFARNRYNAEQSIWINCLRKNNVDVKCKYSTHVNDEIVEQSDRYFVNNFYPITFKKYGVYPLKKYLQPKNNFKGHSDFYTNNEWLHLYQKYCDPTLKIPSFDYERKLIALCLNVEEKKFPKIIKSLFKRIRGAVFDA